MTITDRSFFSRYSPLILWGILLLLMLVSAVSFWKYGPYFSPDTANYFLYALDMEGQKQLYGTVYSPMYPWLLQVEGFLGISQITWASTLIVVFYLLQLFGVYQLSQLVHQSVKTGISKGMLVCFSLIMFHVWWSFRLITWVHADGVFYVFFFYWLYFGFRLVRRDRLANRLLFSLLSAGMVWVKLNAVMLLPFFGLLWWIDHQRNRWILPFGAVLGSYLVYQQIFPGDLLSHAIVEGFSDSSADLLISYVQELLRVSLGFVFSDYLTAHIPGFIAFPGGIGLIGGLLFCIYKWKERELGMKFFWVLFALTYLICFLAFQYLVGFEEINFRTLFPFFWALFWAFLMLVLEKGYVSGVGLMGMAALIFVHSLAGHYLYAQKQHRNSLFEAKELQDSELLGAVKEVLESADHPLKIYADHTELLSFALDNRPVYSPSPKRYFRAGKTRVLPSEEQVKLKNEFKNLMEQGEAVLILFNTEIWPENLLGGRNRWQIQHYPNGLLIDAEKERD